MENMLNMISWAFVIFLFAALAIHYIAPKKYQWACLLASNLFFYVWAGPANTIFIVAAAASTFIGASVVWKMADNLKSRKADMSREDFRAAKENAKGKKRAVLAVVLLVNVGTLAVLKYVPAIASCFGWRGKGWLLPLGISFYTFQTLGYFMDVYNGKYAREKSFF